MPVSLSEDAPRNSNRIMNHYGSGISNVNLGNGTQNNNNARENGKQFIGQNQYYFGKQDYDTVH